MTRLSRLCLAAAALVAAAAPSAAAPARPVRPLVSLSATPTHLTLVGKLPQKLVLHNDGATRLRIVARPASFSFDLYGNAALSPRSDPARSARPWLVLQPRRLVLAPGRRSVLRIRARPARHALPGDHPALLLLSALPPRRTHVSVRTRLGVLVFVRVPGRIVRRVVIGDVWVARRAARRSIVVTAINRGDVAERLQPGQLSLELYRGNRPVALVGAQARDLLPHTRGLVPIPLKRALRGRFTVAVRIAAQPGRAATPSTPALPVAQKTIALRL